MPGSGRDQWSLSLGPDGNPLIGPVPGMKNYCGYWRHGGLLSGGAGLTLAEWMIDGEPSIDVWAMDVARFGEFATPDWGTIKSSENYERRFVMTFPNETLPKGRKQKTTALYDRMIAKGAVMDQSFGLEHVLWFADGPEDAYEVPTFERNCSHNYVAEEIRPCVKPLGIRDRQLRQTRIQGHRVTRFSQPHSCRIRAQAGPLGTDTDADAKGQALRRSDGGLSRRGSLHAIRVGGHEEAHRWSEKDLPADVAYANVSDDWHGIALSGPKSRELLARITRDDVSAEALKFRDLRQTFVGGVPVILNRISFSGELGYEIYCKPQYLMRLADAIEEAGADLGYRWYGACALLSMRLEKGWGVWTMEYRPDFNAVESGMDVFINWKKDFRRQGSHVKGAQ